MLAMIGKPLDFSLWRQIRSIVFPTNFLLDMSTRVNIYTIVHLRYFCTISRWCKHTFLCYSKWSDRENERIWSCSTLNEFWPIKLIILIHYSDNSCDPPPRFPEHKNVPSDTNSRFTRGTDSFRSKKCLSANCIRILNQKRKTSEFGLVDKAFPCINESPRWAKDFAQSTQKWFPPMLVPLLPTPSLGLKTGGVILTCVSFR